MLEVRRTLLMMGVVAFVWGALAQPAQAQRFFGDSGPNPLARPPALTAPAPQAQPTGEPPAARPAAAAGPPRPASASVAQAGGTAPRLFPDPPGGAEEPRSRPLK